MSRLFDDASTQYIEVDVAPISGAPLTFSVWAYPDASQSHSPLFVGDKDVGSERAYLSLRVTTDVLRYSFQGGGGNPTIETANAATLNAWNHCFGRSAASDDHEVILNGDLGNAGTSSFDVTVADWDRTTIGRLGDSTPNFAFSGRLAEVAIWDVALSDDEAVMLSLGFSPLFVRPQGLVLYAPLVRDIIDRVGGLALADTNGTTVADHLAAIYPAAPFIGLSAAAAPAAATSLLPRYGHPIRHLIGR